MPIARYDIHNDGVGPYAVFYCDQCGREFRSEPAVPATGLNVLGRSALEGVLHEIPIVGSAIAGSIDDPRYAHSLTPDQVQAAWVPISELLRECPTCRRFVCPSDFDATTGTCTTDAPTAKPRRPRGHQAATPPARVCPQCQAPVAAAHAFCTNCGRALPAQPSVCGRCGTPVEGRFCGTCGAPTGAPDPMNPLPKS